MKKLIVTAAAAVMMSALVPSQAQSPTQSPAPGPSTMANAVPAALCGPGYTPTNISYKNGKADSYRCTKNIPDQRPCNQNMQKKDDAPVAAGNTLRLSYTCFFPVG